jgi:hypothetical protein
MREKAEMEPRPGRDDDLLTHHTIIRCGFSTFDSLLTHKSFQKGEGLELSWSSRFFHRHLERRELSADLDGRQKMNARREDGGFNHGVFGTIEPEEISQPADMHDAGEELGPIVRRVDLLDFKLIPPAGIGKDLSGNFLSGKRAGGLRKRADCRACQEQNIIVDVKNAAARGNRVATGLRRFEGAELHCGHRFFDDRPHWGDVEDAGGIPGSDDTFENHFRSVTPSRKSVFSCQLDPLSRGGVGGFAVRAVELDPASRRSKKRAKSVLDDDA